MKKLLLVVGTLVVLLVSTNTQAGVTLGNLGDLGPGITTPNPETQPNSRAYGKSLAAWVEVYLRNLFEGEAQPSNSVVFLPIIGDSPFEIVVKPGSALMLPIALWLGFPGDPELGPDNFYGAVTLDGKPVAVPNEAFYIKPAYIEPLILDLVAFYEGIAILLKPLTPGQHTLVLSSSIYTPDGLQEFNNTWNIMVTP